MAYKKTADKRKAGSALREQTVTKPSKSNLFPVVGIGASAGGLEAFTQLFKNMPPRSGIAFVLIQHLAPSHESMLTGLLSKTVAMPVREVKDGVAVEPDNVYVIPPDREMTIFHGVLRLSPREKIKGQYMPVDSFLRSLAEDRGNNAIAVIMSGTGSDGSMGIRAIKGEGGTVFAQDETAKYDGMPRSAVETNCVDFVMPPDKIAAELIRISRHPYLAPVWPAEVEQIMQVGEDDLHKMFSLLRSARGADFTHYKRSTIMRRITRRMMLQKIEGIQNYVAYLKENPSEIETLYQDILINVTSFFRDPGVFDALKNNVFPHLLNNASADVPVRIWVPACSTGEEAYSIAISLMEYMEDNKSNRPVQIFATDIDEVAVEKARKGFYPENISKDVSPERLRRFFEKTEGGYIISKSVREMCIFAKHNIIKDPPFSKVDLVSCRNVLIYFGPDLQEKAIQVLLYALSPKGFLMIGPSETLGEFGGLFSVVDRKNTIFAKRAGQKGLHLDKAAIGYVKENASPVKSLEAQSSGIVDIQREADTIVLGKFSPAGFVVNESMKILQFRGDTSPYLRPTPGEASLNLLKMVCEELVAELRTAIHQAKKQDVQVRKERVRFKHNNLQKYITIDVIPFKTPASGGLCFLILFEESLAQRVTGAGKGRPKRAAGKAGPAEDEETIQLRQELAAANAHLRTVTEEYEAANEELRALNEELQSSNEEMQSINEELETAKEELQSTNEELTTVNDELQSRNEEMRQLNNDLVNVLRGVEIPIVLLGSELQIRRFNDAAGKMLNLIPSDVGRPMSDIKTNISITDLEQMVPNVINTLATKEKEIQDVSGRWYSLTIRPYKTVDNRIDGVLMTIVDINDMKLSLLRIKKAYDYANDIVETVREPLIILDSGLKVITANRSFYENFRVDPEETEGSYIYDLGNGQWNIPELRKLLQEVLPGQKAFSDFEVTIESPDIGRRTVVLNARAIRREEAYPTFVSSGGKDAGTILLAIEDITDRKKIEDAQLFLVQSGWLRSGEDFFKSLARYLAENLGMDYVCIDRLQGEGLVAQTVAIYFDGKFEDNVSYALKDTPCGDVVGKTICCFPAGVRHLYPQDVILQEMIAESYVGTTLWSSEGQPIGLIAIIGRQPLVNPQLAESILRLVALRAAGELERRQAEDALHRAKGELEIRVRERTAELLTLNEELQAQKEKLRSSHERLLNLTAHLQSVREEERTRIAREIHDELGQALTALKLDMSWIMNRLPEDQKEIFEKIKKMSSFIEETTQTTKRICAELRPSLLDHLGIAAALEWQMGEMQRRSGLEYRISVDPEDITLKQEIATVIFRVFQEALTNIARHAEATRVEVALRKNADMVTLTMSDNGKGITEDQMAKLDSYGLLGIQERARSFGGDVKLEGVKGKGTTLTLSIPLAQSDEKV